MEVRAQPQQRVGDHALVRVEGAIEEEREEQRGLVGRHGVRGEENHGEGVEEKTRVGQLCGGEVESVEKGSNEVMEERRVGAVMVEHDREQERRLHASLQAVRQQPHTQLALHLLAVIEHARQTQHQLASLLIGQVVVNHSVQTRSCECCCLSVCLNIRLSTRLTTR